jgi:hypothetical protein
MFRDTSIRGATMEKKRKIKNFRRIQEKEEKKKVHHDLLQKKREL